MIIFKSKLDDMFTDYSDVLINPCNCVGVAGAGLSLEFKKLFPSAHKKYLQACKDGTLKPGKVYFAYNEDLKNTYIPEYICHFPTKDHWKNPSKLEYIISGMQDFVSQILELYDGELFTYNIPALGAGLGNLLWSDVQTIILEELKKAPETATFNIYPPR